MTSNALSHAILVDVNEAESLLSGKTGVIIREQPTTLRAMVGLLRTEDKRLVGTARLVDVVPADAEAGEHKAHAWCLLDCSSLAPPVDIARSGGPLWLRLTLPERKALLGEGVVTAEQSLESAEAFVTDNVVSPPMPTSAESEREMVAVTDPARELEEPAETMPVGADLNAEAGAEPSPLLLTEIDTTDTVSAVEFARARAMHFVPASMVSSDEALRILIRLRDDEIKPNFPSVRPESGILRRNLLHALLDAGVASSTDYEALIPADMRQNTDSRHVEAYLEPILAILEMVE